MRCKYLTCIKYSFQHNDVEPAYARPDNYKRALCAAETLECNEKGPCKAGYPFTETAADTSSNPVIIIYSPFQRNLGFLNKTFPTVLYSL